MTDQRRGRDGPQGPDGRQGQDGREGDAGRQGERGASVTGDRGARGKEGRVGRAGPLGIGLFLALVIYTTGLAWSSDFRACTRTNTTRSAVRTFSTTAFDARTAAAALDHKRGDWQAYRVDHNAALKYAKSIKTAHALSCSGLFPENG